MITGTDTHDQHDERGRKALTNEELVSRYQAAATNDDRQQIIAELYTRNEGLIGKLASKYAGMIEHDDAMQEAYFGLIEAAKRFDASRGTKFSTYARIWILQAIQRAATPSALYIPEHIRMKVMQLQRLRSECQKRHGRDPTPAEIWTALKVMPAQLDEIRRAEELLRVRSLDETINEDDTILAELVPDPADHFEEAQEDLFREELHRKLWSEAEKALSADELQILRMKYQAGKTLAEISDATGKTLDQIRNIYQRALRKMRTGPIRRKLEPFLDELAATIGYRNSGLQRFRETGCSIVERIALKLESKERHLISNTIK